MISRICERLSSLLYSDYKALQKSIDPTHLTLSTGLMHVAQLKTQIGNLDKSSLSLLLTAPNSMLARRFSSICEAYNVNHDFFNGDCNDTASVAQHLNKNTYSHILNFAGLVPVDLNAKDPRKAFESNALTSLSFLTFLAQTAEKNTKFIYISSSHVYKNDIVKYENSTTYSATKGAGELLVTSFNRAVPSQIVRIFSIFDWEQNETFLIPNMFSRARNTEQKNADIRHRYTNVNLDIISSEFCCLLLLKAVLCSSDYVVEVGSGRTLNGKDIFQRVCDIANNMQASKHDITRDGQQHCANLNWLGNVS